MVRLNFTQLQQIKNIKFKSLKQKYLSNRFHLYDLKYHDLSTISIHLNKLVCEISKLKIYVADKRIKITTAFNMHPTKLIAFSTHVFTVMACSISTYFTFLLYGNSSLYGMFTHIHIQKITSSERLFLLQIHISKILRITKKVKTNNCVKICNFCAVLFDLYSES